MMSFNYTGHMVVEVEEALKDQTVRISVQNIFLFKAFSRFKKSLVACKAKEAESEILC